MNYSNRRLVLFIVFMTISVSGCARPPWGVQPEEDIQTKSQQLLEQAIDATGRCAKSWQADIDIQWNTPLHSRKLSGYIKVLEPSTFKFISYNPLGQPLLAIASTGDNFQILDVLHKQFTHGSTDSYALHNGIDPTFVSGKWGQWMSGRIPTELSEKAEFLIDREDRGIWVTTEEKSKIEATGYYLLNRDTLTLEEMRLYSPKNKLLAVFHYSNRKNKRDCPFPTVVKIDELPFGATFTSSFSNIEQADADERDYSLPQPSDYFIQLMP